MGLIGSNVEVPVVVFVPESLYFVFKFRLRFGFKLGGCWSENNGQRETDEQSICWFGQSFWANNQSVAAATASQSSGSSLPASLFASSVGLSSQ